MSDNRAAAADEDHTPEVLAAELTVAAYSVALRHGVADKWLDFELDLWRALADTVKAWERGSSLATEATVVCAWAAGQAEAARGDVHNGLGHWHDVQGPL